MRYDCYPLFAMHREILYIISGDISKDKAANIDLMSFAARFIDEHIECCPICITSTWRD